jgi:hypothetical protein
MFGCFHIVHWLFSCHFFKFTSHYPRCCEYALLVLEYWADAPEIQRSADLYEDMIKCCVADAMSEVGSISVLCCISWHVRFCTEMKPFAQN